MQFVSKIRAMNNRLKLPKVMYISLDGMMEPLGYSQVFKYLEKLSVNHKITLISFEKSTDLMREEDLKTLSLKFSKNNITWVKFKYRSGFLGLSHLINLVNLTLSPIYFLLFNNIRIVHIRSYMPGIAIPLLSIFFKFKLIFDMRGFWADERHDRHNWRKKSLKYRFFKRLETYLLYRAESIITLTHSSQKIICNLFQKKTSQIHVIPTCVDLEEFKVKKNINASSKMIIGYLGSVDTAYDFDKFLFLVNEIYYKFNKNIELRIFTSEEPKIIKKILIDSNLDKIDLIVKFVERKNLTMEISKFDFLGFHLKENFSVQASMPTKIAEVLACGVPIVCNAFNEDIEKLIREKHVGFIYNSRNSLTKKNYMEILDLKENIEIHDRCAKVAHDDFSLTNGAHKYETIYAELLS